MNEHPTDLGSTGAAKEALGLDVAQPNYNHAANTYWDACRQIEELKTENEQLREAIIIALGITKAGNIYDKKARERLEKALGE